MGNSFPGSDYGQMIVVHGAADTIAQVGFSYADSQMYFRTGNPASVGGTGAWGAWKNLAWSGGANASGTWNINILGVASNLAENPAHYTHIGAWGQPADAANTFLVNRAYMSDSCTGNAATSSSCTGNAATATTLTNKDRHLFYNSTGESRAEFSVYHANRVGVTLFNAGIRDWYMGCVSTGALGWYTEDVANLRATLDGAGNFTATGNVSAYSDIRLKKDLEVIGGALDKVQQLTGYTFTRIEDGTRQSGLVAQEVQKVLPEVVMNHVGEEGKPDTLSLAYGNMAGLFVEAIKELRAEVIALRAEVAELRGA
jgi:hypothetical protein